MPGLLHKTPPKAEALSGADMSKTISRVMSLDGHLSRPGVTARLQRPTRERTGRPCSLFGLASDGVYMCPSCYQEGGSLLHCLSTLTGNVPAVYFCCTVLGVASTRRYLASCPVKPGLSSPAAFRLCSSDHLSYSKLHHFIILFPICLHMKTAPANKFPDQGISRHLGAVHSQEIIQEF